METQANQHSTGTPAALKGNGRYTMFALFNFLFMYAAYALLIWSQMWDMLALLFVIILMRLSYWLYVYPLHEKNNSWYRHGFVIIISCIVAALVAKGAIVFIDRNVYLSGVIAVAVITLVMLGLSWRATAKYL